MNLYCDIIRQRFVQGFRFANEIRVFLTQNDDETVNVYLVVPSRDGGRYPFMYDANSGKAGTTATATLCNPGGTPLTLTAPLTLTNIENGFSGTLHLNTTEIDTFLTGRAERTAFLAIEWTDSDGNKLTSFLGEVTLRMAATAAGTVSIPGVIRRRDITGYIGGGPTKLDGVTTIGKAIGTRWDVTINGAESHWEYTGPGATPTDVDSGIILTTDGGQLVRTIGV